MPYAEQEQRLSELQLDHELEDNQLKAVEQQLTKITAGMPICFGGINYTIIGPMHGDKPSAAATFYFADLVEVEQVDASHSHSLNGHWTLIHQACYVSHTTAAETKEMQRATKGFEANRAAQHNQLQVYGIACMLVDNNPG